MGDNTILRALNQRPIAYYPIYTKVAKGMTAGVVLSQLMYWFSKKDKIYKTDKDIMAETGLTQDELRSAKKKIKNLVFIDVTREGIPAKTFYKIDWEAYSNALNSTCEITESSIGELPNTDSGYSPNCNRDIPQTITETTTENTTKTTNTPLAPKGEQVVSEIDKDFEEYIERWKAVEVLPTPKSNTKLLELAKKSFAKLRKDFSFEEIVTATGLYVASVKGGYYKWSVSDFLKQENACLKFLGLYEPIIMNKGFGPSTSKTGSVHTDAKSHNEKIAENNRRMSEGEASRKEALRRKENAEAKLIGGENE